MWGQSGFPFLQEFKDLLSRSYEAGFNEADFKGHADDERLRINAWVEEKTAGRIRDILKPPDVTPLTTLVLANAIYFKAAWAQPFREQATREGDFFVSDKETVKAQFMNRTGEYPHAETPVFEMILVPYLGGELVMAVFLPKARGGLAELEKALDAKAIGECVQSAKQQSVEASIPKFRIGQRYLLNGTLAEMGVKDAFSGESADFSGITGKKDIWIGLVIHQSFVEVNEAGTEAAAATIVSMKRGNGGHGKARKFVADRPFMFAIMDLKTGAMLFLGRVENPAK